MFENKSIIFAKLKRILAISLLFLYIFTATEFHQFLKIPQFVEHFQEHQLENHSITFLQFLTIHYAHGNVQDEDYAKDMKLPFKTCQNDFSSVQILLPHTISTFSVIALTLEQTKKQSFYSLFLTPTYLSTIWQPPRIA